MSFNIPSYQTPTGGNLGQAVEAAPGLVAHENAQIATDKATTETAGVTADAQKAQAEVAKGAAQDQTLQRMISPALTNPEVAKSPQWQKLIGDSLKERGLQIPKGADGSPDLAKLQGMVAPLVKANLDPESALKLANLPPGPAREALASMFNPASITPQMMSAPMVPDAKSVDIFAKDYDTHSLMAEQGRISPKAFLSWASGRQAMLPYIGTSYAAINNDSMIVAGLGAKTRADIQHLMDAGVLDRVKGAKAMSDIQKNTTVEGLNEARTKLLGKETAGYDSRTQALLTNANANQARADAYVSETSQKISDSQNGTWAARHDLTVKSIGQAYTQLNSANTDVRSLAIAMQTARNSGTDPTASVAGQPSLLDTYNAAKDRQTQLRSVLSQIKGDALTANAGTGLLNAISGAGVSNNLEGSRQAFDKTMAVQSPSQPNLFKMPDGTVWDTSAQPPKMIGQGKPL